MGRNLSKSDFTVFGGTMHFALLQTTKISHIQIMGGGEDDRIYNTYSKTYRISVIVHETRDQS